MRSIGLLFLGCCAVSAQIQITVSNAASGAPGIVPGSLARITEVPQSGTPLTFIDPATVSVQIQPAGGSPVSAQVLSVSFFDAIIFVPSSLPVGSATVVLSFGGKSSDPAQVNIVASNVGVFTLGHSGPGPAAVPPYKLTNAAMPGQYVTLWGTGLGSAKVATVSLGGHPAPVSYAGPAPGFEGLDQINFQVPNDNSIPEGCYVAVTVQAGGVSSYLTSIPMSRTPGPCRSPFGFTADTLAKIDAGQRVTLPLFPISSNIGPPPVANPFPNATVYLRTESAAANFFSADASTLTIWTEPRVADDVYYSCSQYTSGPVGAVLISSNPVDLGSKFILRGPQNSLDVPGANSLYSVNIPTTGPVASPASLPAPFFTAGDWQLSDAGSTSVAAFQAGFTLPPPIQITNLDEVATIHRASDQVVTWDPAGYPQSYTVTARLMVNNPFFTAASVSCRVPASTGRLVMPAALLRALPPVALQYQLQVTVTARPDSVPQFTIPLTSGSAMPAILQYYSSEAIPVAIQ